jgi:hypothetical protein
LGSNFGSGLNRGITTLIETVQSCQTSVVFQMCGFVAAPQEGALNEIVANYREHLAQQL